MHNGVALFVSVIFLAALVLYPFNSSGRYSTDIRSLSSVVTGTKHGLFGGIVRRRVMRM